MPREPAAIARWLLILYATAVFAFLAVPAALPGEGEWDMILWTVPLLAWIVGPAAVAAFLTLRARSSAEAWLFVGAETAAVASTVGLCAQMILDSRPHGGQSGVALVLFPLVEFAVLASYTSAVFGTVLFLRRRPSAGT